MLTSVYQKMPYVDWIIAPWSIPGEYSSEHIGIVLLTGVHQDIPVCVVADVSNCCGAFPFPLDFIISRYSSNSIIICF